MRRFFFAHSHKLHAQDTLELTPAVYHHWCNVLRAKVGDQGVLFDGQGGEYHVTLTDIGKKSAFAEVIGFDPTNRGVPYQVTIGLVMSRGERMDYAIQKATELGVRHIQLLTSQYGEVRLKPEQAHKKVEHWQQVAIAACEQCGLNIVPTILPPISLAAWLAALAESTASPTHLSLVLAVPKQAADSQAIGQATVTRIRALLADYYQPQQTAQTASAMPNSEVSFAILVGPEGGLSDEEVTQALDQGFLPWQIGNRVLRTETAPVVALSALHTLASLY